MFILKHGIKPQKITFISLYQLAKYWKMLDFCVLLWKTLLSTTTQLQNDLPNLWHKVLIYNQSVDLQSKPTTACLTSLVMRWAVSAHNLHIKKTRMWPNHKPLFVRDNYFLWIYVRILIHWNKKTNIDFYKFH